MKISQCFSNLKRLFHLNLPRVVLVIVMLIILDIPIKNWETRLMSNPAQIRLATHEVDSIVALRRRIATSNGYKIVYLGDSVVYGPAAGPRETIPFYLESELRQKYPNRDIRVFNYGYRGYGISETFFMLNTLRNCGVDMVIFGVNRSWFNRKPVIEYTNAAKVNPDVFEKPRVKQLGVSLPDNKTAPWSQVISDFMTAHWALFRNRSTITAGLLGKSLSEKLYDYKFEFYDPLTYRKLQVYQEDLHRLWYTKDLGKEFNKNGGKVGWINLSEANSQVGFYRLIADMVHTNHMKALFYATPLNYEMFETYNKLDRPWLNKNLATLGTLASPSVTNFTDFTYAVPGQYFVDSIHMFGPGHKLLAHKISEVITLKGLIQ